MYPNDFKGLARGIRNLVLKIPWFCDLIMSRKHAKSFRDKPIILTGHFVLTPVF